MKRPRGEAPARRRAPPARRGTSIRLAGDPAHGLLFSGYLLAEAALLDRRAVSHAPTLGPAARGPLSGGALLIAGDQEEYPLVDMPGCLLVTSQQALSRYAPALAPEGRLLIEESLRERAPGYSIALPLVRAATESAGTSLVVDLVAAAALTAITGAVSRRSLYEAAERLLPERGRPAALAALDAGMEMGKSRLRA
jgi:Pyruvate/2-oxoacid:ferredoxin oxidoreductase gamma subunit